MDLAHVYQRVVDPHVEDSLGKIARLVRRGSRVLELGPATGFLTRYLKESLGCTVDCVEYSAEMAEQARPHAHSMLVADLDEIDLAEHFGAGSYDHVICADVLEHLRNPWRTLKACRTVLRPDGRLLLSVPNLGHAAVITALTHGEFEYCDEGLLDRTHLRFFTRRNLVDMLRNAGLQVLTLDAVVILPQYTELHRKLDELPSKLREALLLNPDALTYQFVAEASPGEMSEEAYKRLLPPKPRRLDEPIVTRLDWESPESEVKAPAGGICRSLPAGCIRRRVAYALPIGTVPRRLRLRLADRPGYVHLYALRIVATDALSEEPRTILETEQVREWIRSGSAKLTNLSVVEAPPGCTLLATTDDGCFTIELPTSIELASAGSLIVELEGSWPISADLVTAYPAFAPFLEENLQKRNELHARLEAEAAACVQARLKNAELAAQLTSERTARAQADRSAIRARSEAAASAEQLGAARQQAAVLQATLNTIYGSRAWRLLTRWRKLKYAFLVRRPPPSAVIPASACPPIGDAPAPTEPVAGSAGGQAAGMPGGSAAGSADGPTDQSVARTVAGPVGGSFAGAVSGLVAGTAAPRNPGLRVLYVTNRNDAPAQYRCVNPSLHLASEGVPCTVVHVTDPALDHVLSLYSVVVLFRLPWSQRVAEVVRRAREGGAKLVFDIDDLVFDPEMLPSFPFWNEAPELLQIEYQHTAQRLAQTAGACDAFMGSTSALIRAAERRGWKSYLYPNLLNPKMVNYAFWVWIARSRLQTKPVITYMSGSATHNKDFTSIAGAIARVMSERPDVLLLIGGFLTINKVLDPFRDRIIRSPFRGWKTYLGSMGAARVNLAPLAEVNEFTNCKSPLKFFEAAIVGVPTVATPTEPMREAIEHGVNGMLAANSEQWYRAIKACLDVRTSRRLGAAARRTALARFTHAGHRGGLKAFLTSLGGVSSRVDDPPMLPIAWQIARCWMRACPARVRQYLQYAGDVLRSVRIGLDPWVLHQPDDCYAPEPLFGLTQIDPPFGSSDEGQDGARACVAELRSAGRLKVFQPYASPQPLGPWCIQRPLSERPIGDDGRQGLGCPDGPCSLLSPPLRLEPGRFSHLLIEMAVETEQPGAVARISWTRQANGAFTDADHISFWVIRDGRVHRYLVDLRESAWPREGAAIRQLRFDPLGEPGTFLLARIAFLDAHKHEPATDLVNDAIAGHEPKDDRTIDADAAPPRPRRGVDIVVPIYNARKDVERCVKSVLRHATGDWRLVLVDDASTDAALVEFLRNVAAGDRRIVLLRNDANGGFVVTANRGMRHAQGRDVLLLNSDTIVTPGFLDKLVDCVQADDATGIVTPLTNNGTICSVPNWLQDNPLPTDLSVDAYASLVSAISLRRWPELVTAVGFCMFVKAEVIEKIGCFDEAHFGRGFGEENDYCERAKAVGFKIRLCDDLFIAHTGKASFGDEGRTLERTNSRTLAELHPRYFADVAEFCRRRPLAGLVENVRFHLARRGGRRHRAMLFLLHATLFSRAKDVGGTEHFVRGLIEHLKLPRALVVFPQGPALVAAEVFDGRLDEALVYSFPIHAAMTLSRIYDASIEAAFSQILDLFDVAAAHLHHLFNWPVAACRQLKARGIPYVYSIHDYYCVCPNWMMMNHDTQEPCRCHPAHPTESPTCGPALAAKYAAFGLPRPLDARALLLSHREEFGRLLAGAEAVIAPSQAAYETVRDCYPSLPNHGRIIPHGYDAPNVQSPGTSAREPLRVAVVGQIAYPWKGSEEYLKIMDQVRAMPIEWHVFGPVDVLGYRHRLERLELEDRLRIYGPYVRDEICRLLAEHRIDVTLILPTCRETFCFSLSESWAAGVPVIASSQGALPERVKASGAGLLVRSKDEAVAVLCRLCEDRSALADWRRKAAEYRQPTCAENADAYRQAYGTFYDRLVTPRTAAIGDAERILFKYYWHAKAADA